jgi:hypothetical protein
VRELIIQKLFNLGLDLEIELRGEEGTTVELIDIESGTTIAVCRRDTLEEALVEIIGRCVYDVAQVKVSFSSPYLIDKDDVEGL